MLNGSRETKRLLDELDNAQKQQTNADRIRAMSDEELMFFLNRIVVNHHIKREDECRHCPLLGAKPCDTEGLIDWLQQPAE